MGQHTDIEEVLKKTVKLIFDLRVAKRYSQEYVAGELGINQNTYSKWENGQTELTLRKLLQVCDFHQVEPAVFFGNVLGGLKGECIQVQVVEQPSLVVRELLERTRPVRAPTAMELLAAVAEIGITLKNMREQNEI